MVVAAFLLVACVVIFGLLVAALFAINKPPTPREEETRRRILRAISGEGDEYSSAELETMMRELSGADRVVRP